MKKGRKNSSEKTGGPQEKLAPIGRRAKKQDIDLEFGGFSSPGRELEGGG